jgi:hypothetical protein
MQISEIYQFHAWLRGISPTIWRRLLLRSDQTVADLHYALQLAFGWSDSHLNMFRIHGKDLGVYHVGGPVFDPDAPLEPPHTYPVCIGGKRSAPPEDCGGVWAFQQRRDEAPWRGQKLLDEIAECAREGDITALRDLAGEIPSVQTWLTLHKFDRRKVNRRLRQYAIGDPEWQWPQGGAE